MRPRRGKKNRGKQYDLRPLILDLRLHEAGKSDIDPAAPSWTPLLMHLNARPGATGRPDEVLKALGLYEGIRICNRERLIFADQKLNPS
jgi:hypothetical protein